MTCDDFALLLSARLDGQLNAEESAALEAHLARCPECRALAAQLEEVRSAMEHMEELPAPQGFAQGVMEEVRRREAGKQKVVPLFRRRSVRTLTGLAACAVLCIGLYRSSLFQSGQDGEAVAAAQAEAKTFSAAVEPRSAGEVPAGTALFDEEEQTGGVCAVLTLDRLPEGSGLEEGDWFLDEQGRSCLMVSTEELETVEKLAAEQGLTAELGGKSEEGLPAMVVLSNET